VRRGLQRSSLDVKRPERRRKTDLVKIHKIEPGDTQNVACIMGGKGDRKVESMGGEVSRGRGR